MQQSDPIAVRHEAVLERLTQAARDDERIVAAWLQGSRADGTADAFSDIDFYIAVSDDAFAQFDTLAFIERVAPVLVHFQPPFVPGLIVCLVEGPVKLDVVVEKASALEQAERPAVKVLVDKTDVASKLRASGEPGEQEIARRVDELIRITWQGATWPVRLLRRGQWMSHAYSELSLIQSVIVPLMLAQHDRRVFFRNQLTRERLLHERERQEVDGLAQEVLRALASRSLAHAYRAHMRIHEVFARVARAACASFELEYPESAEREVVRFYEREWPR